MTAIAIARMAISVAVGSAAILLWLASRTHNERQLSERTISMKWVSGYYVREWVG